MQQLIAILLALIVTNVAAAAAEGPIALLEFDEVDLQSAIEYLTGHQMGATFNFILDPHVKRSYIKARWEHLTARQALDRILTEQKLMVVTNAATTIARIAPTNLMVEPVPISRVGSDTNGALPSLEMYSVPLGEAITNIANRAGFSVSLDPKFSQEPLKNQWVWFGWKNITASQALAALLDNYDLVMETGTTNSPARVLLNRREDTAPEK